MLLYSRTIHSTLPYYLYYTSIISTLFSYTTCTILPYYLHYTPILSILYSHTIYPILPYYLSYTPIYLSHSPILSILSSSHAGAFPLFTPSDAPSAAAKGRPRWPQTNPDKQPPHTGLPRAVTSTERPRKRSKVNRS